MKRIFISALAVAIGWLGLVSVTQAQVFVRAPFVRVWVGNGVAVRAPFVNLFVPPSQPVYYNPYAQPIIVPPQQPATAPWVPAPQPAPLPQVKNDNTPPQPIQAAQALTLQAFAKSFQAKAGSYEVTLLNPITNQPTTVRFTLPEGTPRRVIVNRDEIEFVYTIRHFVRIEFDREGATVIAR